MPLFSSREKFDKVKYNAAIKMACTRMRMQQNKKRNVVANLRREIALLIGNEKFESARIKVEQCLRDEYYLEALEMVILFCELLSTRLLLFCESTTCPPDLKESLSTVVWATSRTEGIQELQAIRHQTALKFGKEWVEIAMHDRERAVNTRVLNKLSVTIPDPNKCLDYLKGICDEFDLDWGVVADALGASDLIPASAGVYRDGQVDNAFTPPPEQPPAQPPAGPPAGGPPRGGGGYTAPPSTVPSHHGPLGPAPAAPAVDVSELYGDKPAPVIPAQPPQQLPPQQAYQPPAPQALDDDDDLEARLDRLKRQ